MSDRPNRSRRTLPGLALAVAALLTAGCAKPDGLEVGLKDYSTDVVYGGPTTTPAVPSTLPPPLPAADFTPAFPSFIVPPPPPPSAPVNTAPQPVFIDDPCPPAPAGARTADPPTTFAGSPGKGVYAYGQNGEFKVGGAVRRRLDPLAERTVTNIANRSDGTFSYDVVISQFGATTTTSYDVVRRFNDPSLDGLYITRTVQKRADGGTEEFTPVSPGLRILPTPVRKDTTWSSAAVDPARATSMSLEGRVVDIRQVDACGVLVKGWASSVTIAVRRTTTPENAADYTITATYVVAPQLGGLFVADDVKVSGSDRGQTVESTAVSRLRDLNPIRSVK